MKLSTCNINIGTSMELNAIRYKLAHRKKYFAGPGYLPNVLGRYSLKGSASVPGFRLKFNTFVLDI